MQPISPQSPEQRLRSIMRGRVQRELQRVGPGTKVYEVVKRMAIGVYSDGFIHAGNLAYLALVTIFPFFIVMAAVASLFSRSADAQIAVEGFLVTLPQSVRDVVRQPIADVLSARTGKLLWLGGLVGAWTVGSMIETMRDILRRAYGTKATSPFWHYRLFSIAITVGAIMLVMASFSLQVFLTAAENVLLRMAPWSRDLIGSIGFYRYLPLVALWGALYLVFWSLTPSRYRYAAVPKWPGATFVLLWWQLLLWVVPWFFTGLSNYSLTYGGLAGVIIALIFFWLIGFGFVIGAHLNAALAEPHQAGVEAAPVTVSEGAA